MAATEAEINGTEVVVAAAIGEIEDTITKISAIGDTMIDAEAAEAIVIIRITETSVAVEVEVISMDRNEKETIIQAAEV